MQSPDAERNKETGERGTITLDQLFRETFETVAPSLVEALLDPAGEDDSVALVQAHASGKLMLILLPVLGAWLGANGHMSDGEPPPPAVAVQPITCNPQPLVVVVGQQDADTKKHRK